MGFFKKSKSTFGNLAGIGISAGVTGAIISKAPPGVAGGLGQGLSTAASFVPLGVTVVAGKSVLDEVRKLGKKRKRTSFY